MHEQKFVEDYFISIAYLINKVIDEWEDRLAVIKNDKYAFKFEYMGLLLWLTVQKFANLFDDMSQRTRIIDGVHNQYYNLLRKKLNMKTEDLQKIVSIFNDRYREYDKFLPLAEDENLFKLCRKFAEHIDSCHQTNYKADLMEVIKISDSISIFFESTEFVTKEFIKENYKKIIFT